MGLAFGRVRDLKGLRVVQMLEVETLAPRRLRDTQRARQQHLHAEFGEPASPPRLAGIARIVAGIVAPKPA